MTCRYVEYSSGNTWSCDELRRPRRDINWSAAAASCGVMVSSLGLMGNLLELVSEVELISDVELVLCLGRASQLPRQAFLLRCRRASPALSRCLSGISQWRRRVCPARLVAWFGMFQGRLQCSWCPLHYDPVCAVVEHRNDVRPSTCHSTAA